MSTLAQIRKENQKLRSEMAKRKSFAQAQFERKQLLKENDMLKHPMKYNLLKATGEFVSGAGKAIQKGIEKTKTRAEERKKAEAKFKPRKTSRQTGDEYQRAYKNLFG